MSAFLRPFLRTAFTRLRPRAGTLLRNAGGRGLANRVRLPLGQRGPVRSVKSAFRKGVKYGSGPLTVMSMFNGGGKRKRSNTNSSYNPMEVDNPPPYNNGSGRTGSGRYKGRFAKKTGKSYKSDRIDWTRGVNTVVEEFGEVDDNDTCYLMTPACNDTRVIECIVVNIVKKLLASGIGWDATAWKDEIKWNATTAVDPNGLVINLHGGRPDNTDGNYDAIVGHSMVNGNSIFDVAQTFIPFFEQYSRGELNIGGTVSPNAEMYSMVLISSVRNAANTGTTFQTLSCCDFEREVVHWKGFSRMKVQNRTNTIAGTTSTDTNDAKPLEGKLYDFKGLPRTRAYLTGDFKVMSVALCVKSFGAATAPNDFKEPPPGKLFANCTGTQKVRLEPGEIKDYTNYQQGKMQLKPFLKKLCLEQFSSLTTTTMFNTKMLALEELINSTDVNAVRLGYENHNSTTVCLVTKRKKCATQPYYVAQAVAESA